MKLVWHIIKKDLRAVWPLALGWFALIAVRIPLLAFMVKSADEQTLHYLPLISGCANLGDVLLIISLVRSLVHEDALVGDKAFWTTRPITGGQLLAAKTIGLILICLVSPLVLLVPTWYGFGFSGAEILHAAAVQILLNACFAVAGLLFAVVTRQVGSFWLALVATAAAVMISFIAFEYGRRVGRQSDYLELTHQWFAIIVGVGLVLIGIVHQFKKRRTVVTIGCYGMGAVAFVPLFLYWPVVIPFLNRIGNRETLISQPAKIEFLGDRIQLATWAKNKGKTSTPDALRAEFVVSMPTEYGRISVNLLQGQWIDAKGEVTPVERFDSRKNVGPLFTIVAKPKRRLDGTYSYYVPMGFSVNWLLKKEQPLDQTGFLGKFKIEFLKSVTMADLELAPGAKVGSGSYSARLLSVKPYENAVKLTLLTVSPSGEEEVPYLVDDKGKSLSLRSRSWSETSSAPLGITIKQTELTYRTSKSDEAEVNTDGGSFYNRNSQVIGAETQENVAERGWRVRTEIYRTEGYSLYDLKAEKLSIVKEDAPAK